MFIRTRGAGLLASLVVLVGACSGGNATVAPSSAAPSSAAPASSAPASQSGGPSGSAKAIKVGVVTDVGQLEDKSFNQSSNDGAKEAATQVGGTHDVIVTQQISDYAANIAQFAQQKYDVIVTVGFLIGSDTTKAAKANPDIKFIGVDQAICVDEKGDPDPTFACKGDPAALLPNYQGIVFAEQQPGYLAGIVAASITKSGVIGAVGGTNVPAVVRYWRGYENGAKSVKSDIKVLYQETDPDPAKGFNNPQKGKALAQTFIGQKADVLFQIAGLTGQGALEAACDAKIWGIGVDVDQSKTLPNLAGCIATSAEKKLQDAVKTAVLSVADGSFKGGNVTYDAKTEPPGIGLAPFNPAANIPADVQSKVDTAFQAMKAGSLDACAPVKCTVSGT